MASNETVTTGCDLQLCCPDCTPRAVCPITMEPIDPGGEWTHAGVTFDVFALYTYFLKTVNYVNPVNRIPFTLSDLESLETKIKEICGEDAIAYNDNALDENDDVYSCGSSTSRSSTPLNDYQVQLHLMPALDSEVIRVQVTLNVPPPSPVSSVSSDGGDLTSEECSVCEDTVEGVEDIDDVDYTGYTPVDLPPSRCFPSIVRLFNNSQRTKKIKADMDVIQYLMYDSLDVMSQIVDLLTDSTFHQLVWEQTSPSVIDAVTQIVGTNSEATNRDVGVEVLYSDCWETYRGRLLRVLNRRYAEIIHDIYRVDRNEAELCIRSHLSDVQNNTSIPSERRTWLCDLLERLLVSPSPG